MLNTRLMYAVLLDTKGPEIRGRRLKDGKPVLMEAAREVTLHTDYSLLGDERNIAMSYKKLPEDVEPGAEILIGGGSIAPLVVGRVTAPRKTGRSCASAPSTAPLGERKNVNLPGVVVDLRTITEKDRSDILHGLPNNIDFIAASFVRKGSDVEKIRAVLGRDGAQIKIISKVENQEGLVNFDDILEASDGVMVARGDLGMEIPTEKIFLTQKLMIEKCNAVGGASRWSRRRRCWRAW